MKILLRSYDINFFYKWSMSTTHLDATYHQHIESVYIILLKIVCFKNGLPDIAYTVLDISMQFCNNDTREA